MTGGKTILVADDDRSIRTILNQALVRAGYNVRVTGNASTMWHWVSEGQGDILITDVVLPDENVFNMLPRIKRLRPGLPIIVMSALNTFQTAVSATENGAYEYFPKPFDLHELQATVGQALSGGEKASEPSEPAPRPAPPVVQHTADQQKIPLIGSCAAMQEIYRVLARLMGSDLTVMISGESGTGKELVAKALHDYGKRRAGPFVAVNMASIPRDMIESDLFGHEKGALAGQQDEASQGRFKQADRGTLFLDEIGDMPTDAQTRLLRVLQEGEYSPVGGARPVKVDVRIIASTNKNLRDLIAQGQFRQDLFYRLNVVPIRLPPLRERVEDIPDLVRHFVQRCTEEGGGSPKTVDAGAMAALQAYPWPGNVRELENLVRRISVLYSEDAITEDIISAELTEPEQDTSPPRALTEGSLSQAVEQHLKRYFARHGDALPPDGLHDRILREVERPLIQICLAATKGNQLKASHLLGLNRNTLRKKIRDLGVDVIRGVG